jgi:hypothetical protein
VKERDDMRVVNDGRSIHKRPLVDILQAKTPKSGTVRALLNHVPASVMILKSTFSRKNFNKFPAQHALKSYPDLPKPLQNTQISL